jgi:hypothetical protein
VNTSHDHDIRNAPRWTDRLIDRIFVPRSRQGWKHWLAWAAIGAAFGAGVVLLSDRLLGEGMFEEAVEGAGSGAVLALGLVTAMLFIGAYVLVMGSSRRAMQRAMELDDAEPGEAMMASFRLSALALGCQAGLILLVMFDGLPAAIALAIGAALLIAEQWLAWRTYANMDELWRQATLESCALQSALLSLLLGGWAVLHAYGTAPALSPLAVLVALLLTSVVTSVFASHRRGMFA